MPPVVHVFPEGFEPPAFRFAWNRRTSRSLRRHQKTEGSNPSSFSPHLDEVPRAPGRAVLVCAGCFIENIYSILFYSNPSCGRRRQSSW